MNSLITTTMQINKLAITACKLNPLGMRLHAKRYQQP